MTWTDSVGGGVIKGGGGDDWYSLLISRWSREDRERSEGLEVCVCVCETVIVCACACVWVGLTWRPLGWMVDGRSWKRRPKKRLLVCLFFVETLPWKCHTCYY